MKVYFKLNGLEHLGTSQKIYKEIAAINGVDDISINFHTQEMVIEADTMKLPRIEHAIIVIMRYLFPQINVGKVSALER